MRTDKYIIDVLQDIIYKTNNNYNTTAKRLQVFCTNFHIFITLRLSVLTEGSIEFAFTVARFLGYSLAGVCRLFAVFYQRFHLF